ncbi:MAG: hypothetical protein GY953_40195 [bacterium]|nr:hypothetical protein [bacterium]
MGSSRRERLPYTGESAQTRLSYERYLADAERGKTALQLKAVAEQMTPDIRRSWSARSFTAVSTPVGDFDALICNVSYHFHKHGQKYGNIRLYTQAARRHFIQHRQHAVADQQGLLKLPEGRFEPDGRIVTYFG